MHKSLVLIILLSSSLLQNIQAQQSNEIETLTQMLHTFLDGASNNDRDTHDNFWAEELIYTSSNGTRFGKAEIMAGFETQTEVSNAPKTIYTAENIKINIYDDMAVVAFKMKGITGVEVQYFLNSGTFIKRDGNWKAVNWQATKVP
ncbi:MAG: nuclear transport factor 2 family protein [Flavobacteriaceae bacterium]|nr:nuclear transport factor 2 family protein [Flavobacteriaceae bacterium]